MEGQWHQGPDSPSDDEKIKKAPLFSPPTSPLPRLNQGAEFNVLRRRTNLSSPTEKARGCDLFRCDQTMPSKRVSSEALDDMCDVMNESETEKDDHGPPDVLQR